MNRLILLTKQRQEPTQFREGLGVVVYAQVNLHHRIYVRDE